jgi:general secretion pathway protein G
MNIKKNNNGFTLIELLVVIAIIGILSSVVLASLKSARIKARDARRIADIKQIQLALQLFYDSKRYYPPSGNCGSTVPNSVWCNSVQSVSNGHWIRNGSNDLTGFIPSDPIDPLNNNNWPRGAYYYYANDYGSGSPLSQWYMIVYSLENYPNPLVESSDGVTATNGTYFHYGNGSNGIITVGVGK